MRLVSYLLAIAAVSIVLYVLFAPRVEKINLEAKEVLSGRLVTDQQRQRFSTDMGRQFASRGWPATITCNGKEKSILQITWSGFDNKIVHQLIETKVAMQALRELGFHQIIITNGSYRWEVLI